MITRLVFYFLLIAVISYLVVSLVDLTNKMKAEMNKTIPVTNLVEKEFGNKYMEFLSNAFFTMATAMVVAVYLYTRYKSY